jgi:hypothetical protein
MSTPLHGRTSTAESDGSIRRQGRTTRKPVLRSGWALVLVLLALTVFGLALAVSALAVHFGDVRASAGVPVRFRAGPTSRQHGAVGNGRAATRRSGAPSPVGTTDTARPVRTAGATGYRH